jgi:hypothetical protein
MAAKYWNWTGLLFAITLGLATSARSLLILIAGLTPSGDQPMPAGDRTFEEQFHCTESRTCDQQLSA